MGVTHLLLLGQFYTIQTNFMYFFANDKRHFKLWLIYFLPHFFLFLCEVFFENYVLISVWLVFKTVMYSRLGYDDARRVYINVIQCLFFQNSILSPKLKYLS